MMELISKKGLINMISNCGKDERGKYSGGVAGVN